MPRATRTARFRFWPPACSPPARCGSRTFRGSETSRRWSSFSPSSVPTSSGSVRTTSGSTPSGVTRTDLDADLAREIRASFLLAGPLLARFGRVTVPPPGGDVIGRRRLDTHIHAFQELGVDVELNGAYEMRTDGLRGKRLYLDEASVMGTENAIMAAVLADGKTCVGHAACEPHIQDLCRFLVSLGANIEGIGSNVLHIEGVDELRGATIGSARSTSRSRASQPSRPRPAETSRSRTSSRTTSSRSSRRSGSSASRWR